MEVALAKASIKRPWPKINHGLINLGRWGVCGLAWKLNGPGISKNLELFAKVMQKISIATNHAFKTLSKHPKVWAELAELFDRADEIEFEDFKKQVAAIFAGIDIVIIAFPNNFFGLQCGFRQGSILTESPKEDYAFQRAHDIFEKSPELKHTYYKIFDLDLFNITEPERRALCQRWEEKDYIVTGKIMIEDIKNNDGRPTAIDWLQGRMGRKDLIISQGQLNRPSNDYIFN